MPKSERNTLYIWRKKKIGGKQKKTYEESKEQTV